MSGNLSNGNLFLVAAVGTIIAVAVLPILKNFGVPGPSVV